MLAQMREMVDKMWGMANAMDSSNVADIVPIAKKNGGIRYAMKLETITMLFDIAGMDKKLNDDQIEFLRYVLHAPIKRENQEEYAKWVKNSHVEHKKDPLISYLIMLDKVTDVKVAED